MIQELRIKGFKKFEDEKFELKGLNLIVGRNSSGKSSVIHSILSLKQSAETPFNGEYIELGENVELMNSKVGADEIYISATTDDEETSELSIDYLGNITKKNQLDSRVVYCSAERIGVEKIYDKPTKGEDIVSGNCRFVFSYLAQHKGDILNKEFVYNPKTLLTLEGQVNYWLEELVGYRVSAEEIDQVDAIRVLYQDANNLKNTNWIRPQNVGTGVTYVAQTIISSLSCARGDILIIENPEIHLHPEAQSKLLEFFTFIESCGVQIVIETHSDHIYNGLRKCVHEKRILLSNQAVYYLSEKENGCTKVNYVPLNADGKVLVIEDGLFDQINKDLNVLLGW